MMKFTRIISFLSPLNSSQDFINRRLLEFVRDRNWVNKGPKIFQGHLPLLISKKIINFVFGLWIKIFRKNDFRFVFVDYKVGKGGNKFNILIS